MAIFTLEIGGIIIAPSWYGAMYAIGAVISYLFLQKVVAWKHPSDKENFIFFGLLGVIV